MDDLIAFLRVRLDEREARATAAATISRRSRSAGFDWQVLDGGGMVALVGSGERWPDQLWDDDSGSGVYHMTDEAAAHVADNDPRFVLADVAAKRQILKLAESAWEDRAGTGEDVDHWHDMREVVAILAAPYASHPDYREEWKP